MRPIRAYVDGSFKHSLGRIGWAVVVVTETDEWDIVWAKLSGELQDAPKGVMDQRNIAAELKAAMMAAAWAKENEVEVVVVHDYKGIGCWPKGEWTPKNRWTRRYCRYMKENEYVVGYEWVEAHSGDRYNEMADRLAKRAIEAG